VSAPASESRRPAGAAPADRRAWPADSWSGPILAVRSSSLGDVVLTTGPLRRLRERRPDLTIDLLTRRAYAPLLARCPSLDRVIVEEDGPHSHRPPYARVLDWQGGWKGRRAAERFAPGAPRLVAPRAALRRRLLVLLGRRIAPPESYPVRLARTLSGAAEPRADLVPGIVPDPAERGRARAALARLGSPRQGWLVFAPAAAHPAKGVPEGKATAIADGLRAAGWGVIRLRPPQSQPGGFCEEPGTPGRLAFSGSLLEVAALLSEVGLFVGSDSGILHLACAVGCPAVALFGPTAVELGYAPLGRALAIGVDLPCRPCHIHGSRSCWLRHARCWKDLAPGTVVAAAADLVALAGAEGRPGSGTLPPGEGPG